jgi:hypothetical protein
VILGIIVAFLASVAALNRKNQTVGLNQEIQYDDFAFSVLDTEQKFSLGQKQAQGVYYLVVLKIANHARRVDYTFNPASAILSDDQDREFHLSTEGQSTLESTQIRECDAPIPAGQSCVKHLVFDVPRDFRNPCLRISEGGAVGDVLDAIFYGTKRIQLPTEQ